MAEPMPPFPPHKYSMWIWHNEHLSRYISVEEELYRLQDGVGEWLSADDREKAIQTGELWVCQWHPETPVGFCRVFASSWENLCAAMAQASSEDPDTQ